MCGRGTVSDKRFPYEGGDHEMSNLLEVETEYKAGLSHASQALVPLTEIPEYQPTALLLQTLSDKYACVVYEVDKPEGMKSAKLAKSEIADVRIALEKKRKEIKEPALRRSQMIDSEANRLKSSLAAIEDPIEDQIQRPAREAAAKAAEEELARVKAEADRIEAENLERERQFELEQEYLAAEREKLRIAEEERRRIEYALRQKIEDEARAARLIVEKAEAEARRIQEEAERAARAEIEAKLAEANRVIQARRAAEAEEARRLADAAYFAQQEERRVQAEKDALAKAEQDRLDAVAREEKRKAQEIADAAAEDRRLTRLAEQEELDADNALRAWLNKYGHAFKYKSISDAIVAYFGKGDKP